MKPYHIKDVRTFLPPYKNEMAEMLRIAKERSIELSHGIRGFILGDKVLTPYAFNESLIATKDEQKIVLTYEKTDKWGISHFLLPFHIPCEPLHFRHEHLHKDSFYFRVYRHITLCRAYKVTSGSGKYGLDAPDQFAPVFDRQCHILGLLNGVFCERLLVVPIQLII